MREKRLARAIMYFGLFSAGVLANFFPSVIVTDQIGEGAVTYWAAALAFSGFIAFLGSATGQWLGEYSGLPLLYTVLGLYGASALLSARPENSYQSIVLGVIMLSLSVGLVARWRDVQVIKESAEERSE